MHGLGSNPDTTWQTRNDMTKPSRGNPAVESSNTSEDICWVAKFLSEDIDSVICKKLRVFFYNHDSYWKRDAIETRLSNLGSNMLHCINSEIRRTEEVSMIASLHWKALVDGSFVIGAKPEPYFCWI